MISPNVIITNSFTNCRNTIHQLSYNNMVRVSIAPKPTWWHNAKLDMLRWVPKGVLRTTAEWHFTSAWPQTNSGGTRISNLNLISIVKKWWSSYTVYRLYDGHFDFSGNLPYSNAVNSWNLYKLTVHQKYWLLLVWPINVCKKVSESHKPPFTYISGMTGMFVMWRTAERFATEQYA